MRAEQAAPRSALVSIVIPAFNHARFLPQAVESVLAQTYPNVELIVLDDGSTDETREVLKRYGDRFRWESQANLGQAATLNKGWAMSRGRVLGYLSADDYLHPQAVERAVRILEQHPDAVLAYPDFEQVDEASRRLRVIRTPEFRYDEMILRMVCPPGPGALFRRSAYEQTGGWNAALRHVPDFEYWLRLGLRGRFQRVPEVLASYRVHDNAQSFSVVSTARADEIIGVIGSQFAQPGMPPHLRHRRGQAMGTALLHSARLHILSGRLGRGLLRAASAVKEDPQALLRPRSYRLLAGGLYHRFRLQTGK